MRLRPGKQKGMRDVRKSYYTNMSHHQLFTLTDADYSDGPKYLGILESLSFPVLIKVVIRPIGERAASSVLGRFIADRKSEIRYRKTMGDSQREKIRRQIRDLENIAYRVGTDRSALVNAFTTFGVSSGHPVKLRESGNNFASLMNMMGLSVDPISYLSSRKLKKTFSPFDSAGKKYLMDTETISTLFPIHFTVIPGKDGVLLGVDDLTEKPVFLDIFAKSSHNVLIFGETGSGKSFFSKVLLMRSVVKGSAEHITILDPLEEYSCKMFPGSCVEIDLENEMAIKGPQKSIDQDRNKRISDPEVMIYRTGNLPDDKATCRIGSLLSVIYERMTRTPNRRKIILIDEAHLILSNRAALEILSRMIRHSRHFSTSVISVTQNLDDLSKSHLSNVIAENSSSLFIFRSKSVSNAEKMRFGLSSFDGVNTEELMGGKNSPYSECLFLQDNRIRTVRVLSSRYEADLISGKEM